MKILPSLALCSVVSCAYAMPQAQLHDVDGQQKIVITHLPIMTMPLIPKSYNAASLVTPRPKKQQHSIPITPVAINDHTPNTMMPITTIKHPVSSVAKVQHQQHHYAITQGETYISALHKWLAKDKLTRVAWAIPPATTTALAATSNGQVFNGELVSVIQQLGKTIKHPLYFSKNTTGLAAIHNIKGPVDIRWVHGRSVKDAIHNLANDYAWTWTQGKDGAWMAPDDYPFIAPYPIVVKRGDFASALDMVLDGYPVQAQLLNATKTIFVVEKE